MGESLPPSDADLVAASRTADSAAYAVLYERHAAAARSLARQLVHGRPEADDVVSEAFARVLGRLKRGGGPDSSFRPYLLTTVRRVAYDRFKAEGKLVVSGEMEAFDPGVPFDDPAIADLERTMIVRAFASLPERWRTVLWHTEIEGARPAEVAALLGVTANGVAALAYRAREGLRQAYLQMHLSGVMRSECRPVAGKLGAFIRGGLAKRETATVAAHLDECTGCRAVYAELADVNVALRGLVAPVILGPAAVAYLAAVSHHGGGVLTWIGGRLLWFRHAPKSQQAATAAGGAAAAAGIVALALALTASTTPIVHLASPPAPARPSPAPPATTQAPAPPPVTRAPVPRPAIARFTAPARAPSRPSPRPAPRPRPRPKPAVPILLAALINPVGALLPGASGFVEFTVTDAGRTVSKQVTAAITLPPGVTYQDPPMAGGWTCATTEQGASCQHASLQPGAVATGYLPVTVAAGATAGAGPSITVSGGGSSVTERGTIGVADGGLGARFAVNGQDTVVTASAALCPWADSSAGIALPGQVLWAGLYWSWRGWQPENETIELRGPGEEYQPVTAADVGSATFPYGGVQSEAFANVTSLVAQYGAGTWSAQVPDDWQADGWALVVVTTDPQAAPGTQVMVLDGARVVGPSLTVPLDALPPGPDAVVSTITWPRDGPSIASFAQNLSVSPAVSFTSANVPYLVGVVAVTDPP
ncbi:MAG TPA: sigma-70 family RNA polymerase sigma factor [Streptosporangiaceae bacterium]|nr:sigma-70 family RNA polymerase sigma factor [Streptosporangiaceae bacterium]